MHKEYIQDVNLHFKKEYSFLVKIRENNFKKLAKTEIHNKVPAKKRFIQKKKQK